MHFCSSSGTLFQTPAESLSTTPTTNGCMTRGGCRLSSLQPRQLLKPTFGPRYTRPPPTLAATASDADDAYCFKGNQMADMYAKAAVCKHRLLADGDALQKKAVLTTDIIARFLVHILSCYHKRFGSFPKHSSVPLSPQLAVCGERCSGEPHYAVCTSHDSRWRCASCFASSVSAEALGAQTCPAPGGNGHSIRSLPNLVFCNVRGAFSATAVKNLLGPCTPCKPGTPRFRSLTRLRRGLHPYSLAYLGDPMPFEPSELRWCRL